MQGSVKRGGGYERTHSVQNEKFLVAKKLEVVDIEYIIRIK